MKDFFLLTHTKSDIPPCIFNTEEYAKGSVRESYWGVDQDIVFTEVDTPSPREAVKMIEVRYKYALIATIRPVRLFEDTVHF